MTTRFTNPEEIASKGTDIYDEKYRIKYEAEHKGKYVAIDVNTGEAYLGDTTSEALRNARGGSSEGIFHLIRIGSEGTYRVSYTSHETNNWAY